jgi:pimeloyl-ACP methyl ester carboxylesterase
VGVDGIHVEVSGHGPALVLTHGFADSADTWAGVVAALSPHFRVVTWDLPAHGRSAVPSPESATREFALAALDDVIEVPGGPVVLVGHSLGGYLSMCRAAANPSGLRGLVLIGTGPGFRDDARRDEWNATLTRIAAELELPPEAAAVAAQPDAWLMEHLGRISLPALLIVGEDDTAYHAGMEYLERKLPRVTKRVVVPGGRHHVQRRHAAEVSEAIERFVNALS